MTPGASIVVINYNGGPRAAANLLRLAEHVRGSGWEIVVVDNCSTDGSPDLMERDVPTAGLIREPANMGYASAVNRGLEESAGDVVVVLNADAVPRSGALQALVDAVQANRDYALLGGVLYDADGSPSVNTARMLPRPAEILREGIFLPPRRPSLGGRAARGTCSPARGVVPVPAIGGAVIGLRRETLAALGPMDREYFLYNEDIEWCRRAARAGLSVGVAVGAEFDHQGGASTRLNEGPAFAARVLADFQYFCEGEGVPPERIRRLWAVRLALRSWLYRFDSRLGILGRRPESRRRAAIYRILARRLATFRWSVSRDSQNGHPSRLVNFPESSSTGGNDHRPGVLQVIPNMEYGGAQRLVETLVDGSLAERYRFEVLCLTHAGEIGEELKARGVPVHVVGLSGWRSLAAWRLAADYAALLSPDLVHSHLIPGDIAAYVGFRGRAARLSTKHNVDPLFSPAVKLFERYILRGQEVLAVSDAVAEAKAHLGPTGMLPPVLQSPPSVPIASSPAPFFPEGGPVRLCAIGRLHSQKRLDIYLRAAAELEHRSPGRFSFRIIGEGQELAALKELAGNLGIAGKVEFLPPVSDVAAALDDTDIVTMVSDYEGLPLTILEMLARGRIPLVRRVPGTDEALPPALEACYVDSSSHVDVACKVMEICEEPDRFIELAHEGLAWVAERSDYASVTGGIYDRLVSADDAPRARKRVLHLITRLIVGGAQENTIASVERVDPERYDSQLWIGPQTGSEGSLIADARSRGIIVRMLPNLVREIDPRRDVLVLIQLVRLLRRERFDIIHTHSSKAGILGRIAARLARVPHITHTVHGWGFHEHMHPALRFLYVVLERAMQPWTRPLVSVSNRTTRIGLESGIGSGQSYRLIRSGIPTARFHPDNDAREMARLRLGLARGDVLLGSVGRLSPQKNPMDFVRAARLLSPGRDRLKFAYVGDGPMREEVERAIEREGLGDRVMLLGIRDDVPDLLRAMDAFTLTSLWEGLPRVVLQALATGVPVVAYDTAGIEEAVIEGVNGHLVPPGDIDRLVEHLARLIDDDELRSRVSAAASSGFDKSFTEDSMIEALEALYDNLTVQDGS